MSEGLALEPRRQRRAEGGRRGRAPARRRRSATHLESPTWVELACGVALTAGTAIGGWPIVRTLGRRITLMRPIDALASQTGSTAVLLGASRDRRAGQHHAGRRLVGRRRRRRPAPLAPRALAGGRSDAARLAGDGPGDGRVRGRRPHPLEVAHMTAKHWFLPDNPDLLGMLRSPGHDHGGGDGRARRWSGGDEAAASRCVTRAPGRRASGSSGGACATRTRHRSTPRTSTRCPPTSTRC